LSKNIISSSCLEEVDGFKIVIENKRCSIFCNGIFYAHCPLVIGYMFLISRINLSVTSILRGLDQMI
jgi:hypothetical protein